MEIPGWGEAVRTDTEADDPLRKKGKISETESHPPQRMERSQITSLLCPDYTGPRQNTPEHRPPNQNEKTRARHVRGILRRAQNAKVNAVATKRINLI